MTTGFNSRSRVGSDPAGAGDAAQGQVSIRAPAWGATWQFRRGLARPPVSIRAPAWGATAAPPLLGISRWFQFALPRGERLDQMAEIADDGTFQFALPRGERQASTASPPTSAAFQFALPRGERPKANSASSEQVRVSIRAPAWGATLQEGKAHVYGRFNSRSRVGSDFMPLSLI